MVNVDEFSEEWVDEGDEDWVDEEDGGGEDDLLACPSCSEEVHEDTQQCPHCGDWITPVDPKSEVKRVIWIVAALLVVLSMILYTVL